MKSISLSSLLILPFLTSCDLSTHRKSQEQHVNVISSTRLFKKVDVSEINGLWMRYCDGEAGHISIPNDFVNNVTVIEVNSNQIVIGAKTDTNEFIQNKIVTFKLIKPVDLGKGGLSLDWNNFSRDSIIAKMVITGYKSAKFTWYGFFDKKTKKYLWTHEFDMLTDSLGREDSSNVIDIKKCH